MINPELKKYIEENILTRYDSFDAAHQRNHADVVIERSLALAAGYDVDLNMVYAIAAYHDTGLVADRKTHHLVSGTIVRSDKMLNQWFSSNEIETMAQAVEDHRASAQNAPRSIYGCIVAEADRNIDITTILTRTVQYGLSNYPELGKEEQIKRTFDHLDEKYGPHGYLKLWIPGSDNERNLHQLWRLMEDRPALLSIVEEIYHRESSKQ